MRILITGSRYYSDSEAVETAILNAVADFYPDQPVVDNGAVTIVHGAAPGADSLAANLCSELGFNEEAHPADWSMGKKAGPLRNQSMVDLGADVCLAFPAENSRGTWDCIRRAMAAGIETKIIGGTNDKRT